MDLFYSKDSYLLNDKILATINSYKKSNQIFEEIIYSWVDDDHQKIIKEILTGSFFYDKKIIVIRDAFFLSENWKNYSNNIDSDIDKIFNLLNHESLPNEVIFALEEDKINTKNKLSKLFNSKLNVLRIDEPTEKEISNFVIKKCKENDKIISLEDAFFLIKKLPKNLQIINKELEKMFFLKNEKLTKSVITKNVSKYFEADIFDINDSFIKNEVDSFLKKFHDYLAMSKDLINLFFLLSSNLTFSRDCLILKKQGRSNQKIAELLNANPYRVKISLDNGHLKIAELNDKIEVLYKINKLQLSNNKKIDSTIEFLLIKNMLKSQRRN